MGKRSITPRRPVYPSPAALITCVDEKGEPNIITLAETFNVSIAKPVIPGIAIRSATYSYDLISRSREFVINLPTTAMLEQVDGVGSVSGRNCDKFARFQLTQVPAEQVRPPLIDEAPVNLECRVVSEQEIGDHQLFLGETVVEHVDEELLNERGTPDPSKLDMLVYAFGSYFSNGKYFGDHGKSHNSFAE